ncbi:hypothetical protein BOX15_Mlig023823g1 [Macrostomum lignano]|uniref:RING-type domain-containing protein n=1 Tax=Macrostomum lignano TaxID=282301 RepID=A0A267DVM9_9PLAT|nr:hypothetical protein BOX15_Mlig023823g1 [Macrostomum lignano]
MESDCEAADDAAGSSTSCVCDQPSCASSSSSSGSIESLEDLTTCPIHLGRLHEPKLLNCSHVFCLTCLEKWDSQQPSRDRFPCPLCRVEARLPAGGLRCLPPAHVHQSIIKYIVDRQCRRLQLPGGGGSRGSGSGGEASTEGGAAAAVAAAADAAAAVASSIGSPRGRSSGVFSGGSGGSRKRSLERKQEILAHLAEDFVRRSEEVGAGGLGGGAGMSLMSEFDKAELLAVRENLNKLITRLDDAESRSQKLQDAMEAATAGAHQHHHQFGAASAAAARYPTVNDHLNDVDLDEIRSGSGGGGGGGGSDSSDAEDALDLSFIRHNMKRNSSYKMKEIDMGTCAELLQSTRGELEIGAAGLLADADGSTDQAELVLLNSCSRSLLVYSSQEGQIKDLPVLIGDSNPGGRLQCHHMRLVNGLVYVSGVAQQQQQQQAADSTGAPTGWLSVVACLQLDGQVVKRIERPGGSRDEPLFAGFFVDSRRGDMVVAQPSDQKVEFFTPCLGRTGHWFTFENLHPQYVTWTRERKMLWVSCPAEGHILIVNDRTGVYRKLTTTQIFDSVPAHIITTSDKRIIFTDNQRQRLFWVIRRSEFIFVQRLQFLQELDEITGIAPLGEDKILVCTRRRICVLKPVRKLRHRKRSKCLIA